MNEPIRVFVGCGPEHELAYKVLEFSILERTQSRVQVVRLLDVEQKVPIPKRWKKWAPTSFSFQRFLIPEACDYVGKGIYLDSDQIVLGDIAGLWNTPFPDGANVLTTGGWQSAVMLIDCEQARWQIGQICGMLDTGVINYVKLSNLKYNFLARVAGALDPLWNVIDRPDPQRMVIEADHAKLLHYTDMRLQPWLRDGHPAGIIWNNELLRAIEAGHLSRDDVREAVAKEYVRPSLSLLIGEDQHKPDAEFIYPDKKRKRKKK